MTSAVARNDPGVQNLDLRIERHMGCMTGFLHLFDRNPNNLAGKRHNASPKRLPFSSTVVGSASPSEKSDVSFSSSTFKPCPSSPEKKEVDAPPRPSLPPPVFNFKERTRSAWGIRESPRLSLDSRAIVDAKGKLQPREVRTTRSDDLRDDQQRRSPSVIARLMGLDALSDAGSGGGRETPSRGAELRRSASESRASRDPSHFRFVDPSSFQKYAPPELKTELRCRDLKPKTSLLLVRENKSFFNSQEFYPEPKRTGSIYGEIERRLKLRGIDEPAKDFETLKQLKRLLHSKLPLEQGLRRNCPPIVVLKPAPRPPRQPARAPPSPPGSRRPPPPASARRDPQGWNRGSLERSPTSPARRRLFNERETTKLTPPPPRRRESPIPAPYSPKTGPRRIAPVSLPPKSPRIRGPPSPIILPPVEDDASTTSISESSVSNYSGRNLLERCDKLLYSIAAVTSSASASAAVADQQPSPVSVLDPSPFFGDDSSPPSRMRSSDFRDRFADWEEDLSTPTCLNGHVEDEDLAYVSKALRALRDPLRDPPDVYMTLEKRRRYGVPGPSRANRRMLFDMVAEFVDRKRSVAPWDAFASGAGAAVGGSAALLREVWAEVRRTRETAEDYLNDVTREAIRKEMAVEDRGWEAARPVAMSDAVLNLERQIFKDLVAEAIRDFADVATGGGGSTCRQHLPRRKLQF